MWIRRKTFESMVSEIRELTSSTLLNFSQAGTLREQNKVLQTNLDWARLRLSQLEKERAQLMYHVTGIKTAAPEFAPTPTPDVSDILRAIPSFEDVGDTEAQRLGIEHDKSGELVFTK